MSQQVMVALAKEVTRDLSTQGRIEALDDVALARLGLDADEVLAIRQGFFDRVLRLGLTLDEPSPQRSGCCFG